MISSLSLSFSLGATGLRVALLVCESEAVLMVKMMHRREVLAGCANQCTSVQCHVEDFGTSHSSWLEEH